MMLVDLAGYVKNQGRSNEAKELYEECVAILAKHQRTHPADYFVSLNNYAIFFMHRRDYDAAQQILERVLDLILPAAKGREVGLPRRLDGLEFILHLNVAYLFMLMHQLTEAKHHLHEADTLFQGLPGPRQKAMHDHFVCLRALWNYEAGKFANAWSEVERVENPDYAASLSVRAKLHLVALDYAAAEGLRRKSFDQERKKGTLHRPELLDATRELAESLFGQGKHDEAIAFHCRRHARSSPISRCRRTRPGAKRWRPGCNERRSWARRNWPRRWRKNSRKYRRRRIRRSRFWRSFASIRRLPSECVDRSTDGHGSRCCIASSSSCWQGHSSISSAGGRFFRGRGAESCTPVDGRPGRGRGSSSSSSSSAIAIPPKASAQRISRSSSSTASRRIRWDRPAMRTISSFVILLAMNEVRGKLRTSPRSRSQPTNRATILPKQMIGNKSLLPTQILSQDDAAGGGDHSKEDHGIAADQEVCGSASALHNFKKSLKSSGSSLAIVDPAHQLHRPQPGAGCLPSPVSLVLLLHVGKSRHRQSATANVNAIGSGDCFFHSHRRSPFIGKSLAIVIRYHAAGPIAISLSISRTRPVASAHRWQLNSSASPTPSPPAPASAC